MTSMSTIAARVHSLRSAVQPFAAAFWPFFAALLLLVLVREPVEAGRHIWPVPLILDAIVLVETSGQQNPPDGDGGRAIGPYQIHLEYWQDALAAEPGLGGSYQDCRRRGYAE